MINQKEISNGCAEKKTAHPFLNQLSASLVVHKTPWNQLEKALICLLKSPVERIFIIDNSPEDSLNNIQNLSSRIIYLKTSNRGFGAGHNIAIKKSIEQGYQFHLVMNADVWWEGDVISELLKKIETDKKIGLISPKTFYPDGDLQFTCRMLPTPTDLFFKRLIPGKFKKNRMQKYLLARHDHNFELNSPYLLGSFLLFRNKAIEKEGAFDERFFMYPEDIDITRRLHKNWTTLYWPKVSIIHEHQVASRKNIKMFLIHFRNMVKYFNKWGWGIDKERDEINKRLLNNLIFLPEGKIEHGRG
ncbi:MAG: glycosyltransferase family 2 protein [Muribaculaceae bacterium]|nr:glycosyltransferase family 2 protein [Muribaculaceae bacterium]